MKYKSFAQFAILITILTLLFSPNIQVYAQEGDGTEVFDDSTLPGWEHSEGTQVTNGVLLIQPENFAVYFKERSSDSYSFQFKESGTGLIIFRYAIGEGSEYTLIIHQEGIVLERAQDEKPFILGESQRERMPGEWQSVEIVLTSSGQQLTLNDNILITTEEDTLLQGGGVGFWVEGDEPVEFDNLVLGSISSSTEGESPAQTTSEMTSTTDATIQTSGETYSERINMTNFIAELTSVQAIPAQLTTVLVNIGLSVILSYILSRVYIHWGSSLSNRRRFAANFILLTITTTFIILVVRSSVALSLGLVGALSIVRFRSAIKEPEELAYLFFAIAIGIGLGDNQRLITVIALAAAILVLGLMRLFRGRQADFNLHVTVGNDGAAQVDFEVIVDTLRENCAQMKLMRFDESQQGQESSFLVEFRDMNQLKQAKNALRSLSDSLTITFLDNKGIW